MVILDGDDELTDVLTICRTLCSNPATAGIPWVIIADSHDETDEIVAFKVGASDYISKPFKLKPIVERLRSLLQRRRHSTAARNTVGGPGLTIHRLRKAVEIEGEILQLTSTECAILELLASRPGHPFQRREILRHCRGLNHNVSERTIDVHVRNLRAKLRNHNLIQTLRGIGYYLNARADYL